MVASFTLIKGTVPLLISMPHNGVAVPDDIMATMTATGKAVEDTDWYMDKLYDFASELGAYILMPTNSRYVIDLNRDPDGVDLYPGANSTELCPTTSFELADLYLPGQKPSRQDIEARISQYWQPYHNALSETLAEIKQAFGCAVLLEAHSIRSQVPRFFEGTLPDFNFGNGAGSSCGADLMAQLAQLDFSPYTQITNGRFKGGYITRHYGQPSQNIHAVQLELSQHTYMNEPTNIYNDDKAAQVKPKLAMLVNTLIRFAQAQSL